MSSDGNKDLEVNLSSDDNKDLEVISNAQARRELSPNITSQVISEIKHGLLFQVSWEELLQAAPTAISCLGACFVASSSPKAAVSLGPPNGGKFQHLKYESVQANLVECGNLGRLAFLQAEKGMGTIQLTSEVIKGKIAAIVKAIGDPASASQELANQLDNIKRASADCQQEAMAMDKKFEEWLLYVCEMHAACVQQHNDTTRDLENQQVRLVAEQVLLDSQKLVVDKFEKNVDQVGEQLKSVHETFKRASDKYPSGWNLVGQQIASDLVGAATTAINGLVQVVLTSLNPVGALRDGFSRALGHHEGGDAPESPARTNISDPAYAQAIAVDNFLFGLQAIVIGKNSDGGIDWVMACGDGNSTEATKSSIGFLTTMLEDAETTFEQVAGSSDGPSKTLRSVLKVAVQVAKGIYEEVKKSTNITATWPAKDSELVKKWQSEFSAQYEEARKLIAEARSGPGTSANGVPLFMEPKNRKEKLNSKTVQAQAVLEAAKTRLTTTQQALSTSEETWVKTTKMLLEQKNKLGEIQSNLSKLTAANVSLTEIKRILIECIKLIINLKQQITNLVRFFQAMQIMVDVCIKYHVEPFLATVRLIADARGADPYEALRIGDCTYTDFQRSQLYSAAVTMHAYFGVFGDISKMWVELSNENIMPGLHLCEELSLTAEEGQMKEKIDRLRTWSIEAIERVREHSLKKQQEIESGMQARISETSQVMSQITLPAESTVRAITAGIEVVREASESQIEVRAQAYDRFLLTEE